MCIYALHVVNCFIKILVTQKWIFFLIASKFFLNYFLFFFLPGFRRSAATRLRGLHSRHKKRNDEVIATQPGCHEILLLVYNINNSTYFLSSSKLLRVKFCNQVQLKFVITGFIVMICLI